MSGRIDCISTGVHPGYKRFPDRHESPAVKAWRCDLTALSQIYNLYFLACNDAIHVYQPSFPDQALLSEPHLILELPVSPHTGSGIDIEDPHSVTRVLVEYLGCDEILLVACDDGDVIGYRIDEIHRCINERMHPQGDDRESYFETGTVKHFLHRNVGESAWGLAVHREARIIAISANTHKILIIAFALSKPLAPCGECLADDSIKVRDLFAVEAQSRREEDIEYELNDQTNIPAISFNNTGKDPSGHWLFSCSIDGVMNVWDIHNPTQPHTVFRLGYCTNATMMTNPISAPPMGPGLCACSQSGSLPHGVWGAIPLDTRAACEISAEEGLELETWQEEPCFEVISPRTERFASRGFFLNIRDQHTHLSLPGGSDNDDVMVLDDVSETGSSTSESGSSQMHNPQLETTVASLAISQDYEHAEHIGSPAVADVASVEEDPTNASYAHEPPSSDLAMDPVSEAQSETGDPDQSQEQLPPQLTTAQTQGAPVALNQVILDAIDISAGNDSDSFLEDTLPWILTHPLSGHLQAKRAYCQVNTYTPWFDRPLFTPIRPLLVATKEEIYLIQRPSPSSRHDPPDRIVTMRRPIHIGQTHTYVAAHDRLCYFAQIPELALFVVASPIGRAAVFSLWYTRSEGNAFEPEYGFNLEYILPFDRNDDRRIAYVPKTRLLGIAVSPVQGMCDKPGETTGSDQEQDVLRSRRWRLLMYYTDHTVLSFDLSKRKRDATPDVSELVV